MGHRSEIAYVGGSSRNEGKKLIIERDPPIYMYTHWCGLRIAELATRAVETLAKSDRYEDSYGGRVVFDTFLQLCAAPREDFSGFGLSTLPCQDYDVAPVIIDAIFCRAYSVGTTSPEWTVLLAQLSKSNDTKNPIKGWDLIADFSHLIR